jgi:glyoxylase-like metal-dependent hydrolase (beta-lactamase superfamily II)
MLFVSFIKIYIMAGKAIIANREVSATTESEIAKNIFIVAPGVWRMKDIFVNVYIVQNIGSTNWVLIDTGLKTSASKIKAMVAEVFGSTSSRPSSIIITHGHFDHVGSLQKLADEWNVSFYCHHMEVPYLTGKSKYPPPDPTVGGGAMAYLSFMFPRGPVNVQEHLKELPEDGSVPELSEWKWLHTPGHAPGHISLFRERDGVLIAGDAFITTNMQSAIAVMMQRKELNGPPKYFTMDWGAAARSVKELSALQPQVVATGHGQAMYGSEVRKALNRLAKDFWEQGIPAHGRYVHEPALANEDGITYVPPTRYDYTLMAAIGISAFAIALGIVLYMRKKKSFLNK